MFHYEGGIKEFVSYLNKQKDSSLSERSFTVRAHRDDVYVEVAMQHNDSYNESCLQLCQ